MGTARVAAPGHLPGRRWRAGDVAVLDLPHLDAATADRLLRMRPSAVLLAGPATSSRYPHRGPELLLESGVVLVDDLGPHLRDAVRDGTTVRVDGGRVLVGAGRDRWVDTPEPLHGREQDPWSVAAGVEHASRSMAARLEAFAETTGSILHLERDLLLEGAGVPEVPVRMAGRPVVVCVDGYGHEEDLHRLRAFVADRRPVLVGVGGGADALVRAGLRPDVVVTDVEGTDRAGVEAMSSGAHVVVHTRPAHDGTAAGRAQGQDDGTTRFATHLTTEDAGILLAHSAGAELVVTAGSHATLEEFLDRGRAGAASSFLTRLRAGGVVVDAATVARLHRPRRSRAVVLLLLLAVLVTLVAVAAATPWGQEQLAVLQDRAASWTAPWADAAGWPPT